MPRATKAPADPDDAPLKRLGGGRWQTRDERFTIEPQSGTWVIVDGEQTDDFGLPLVRGPFPSLTSAKDAIASARSSAPATSPLADRVEQRRRGPTAEPPKKAAGPKPAAKATTGPGDRGPEAKASSARRQVGKPKDEEPSEPGWMKDLDAAERGRARRLITRLGEDDVPDAEGLVRRDLVGDVPALAAHALARHLAELGDDASPDEVAQLLAEGRDERLGVRWRLVDGDGRPILLDTKARRRR
jgi:hypothetical protein